MNKYYTREQIEECNLDDELEGKLDELQTQIDYEYEKANALFKLEEKGWIEQDEYDGDRSYPGTYFAEKNKMDHRGWCVGGNHPEGRRGKWLL